MKKSSSIYSFVFVLAFLLAVSVGATKVSAQTATTTTVRLSKTLLTMPGAGFFTNNDVPLLGARWFDGYFAVSSACSGKNNSKGLWVFMEEGSLVDSLNTCRDTGEGTGGSAAHVWTSVPNVQSVGGGQFIKEMGPNNNRPPLLYKISGKNARFVSKPWSSSFGGGDGEKTAEGIAAIPGYAALLELQVSGGSNGSQTVESKNVLYRLPSWNEVDDMNAAFIPLTGIGKYILGTPIPGNSGLVLYEVSDNKLKLVGTAGTSVRPVAVAVDPASLDDNQGGRVGLLFSNVGSTPRNTVGIYSVGSEGLKLLRTVNLPDSTSYSNTNSLAISGEYTAFLDCGLPPIPPLSSGASDNFNARTCGVGVLKGTERLSVERLPNATTIGTTGGPNEQNIPIEIYQPAPYALALSRDAKDLLAVTSYGAYLYDIGTATSTPPIATTTPPIGAIGFGGLGDVLAFATSYFQLLQAVMGHSALIPSDTSFGGSGTTSPVLQGLVDQAIQIINLN